MRIAILGDTHHGMRGDSIHFHNLYKDFYLKTFFPYLDKHNITTIFQLGDLFDRRKYINFQTLALCRKYFFDPMKKRNIQFHTLLGNHDVAYKNTLEVNSPNLLLKDYENIVVHEEPATVNFGGTDIDIIPWICLENESAVSQYIKESTSDICFGHFELSGFEMDRGNICHEGMDASVLSRYEMVLSGHFHHKSSNGHIFYVGTPGEMTWADYDCERGFHIFDTETRTLEFIPNNNKMFHKIKYNEETLTFKQISNNDYSYLSSKYVKIVVQNRNNPLLLDTLIDKISNHNPLDLTIVEDYVDQSVAAEDLEIDEAQDTLTILNKYLDGLTLTVESGRIKTILRDVYNEALAMENT